MEVSRLFRVIVIGGAALAPACGGSTNMGTSGTPIVGTQGAATSGGGSSGGTTHSTSSTAVTTSSSGGTSTPATSSSSSSSSGGIPDAGSGDYPDGGFKFW